ncbi:Acyl carrier protein 3 [Arabidopsis thaliana]|uniref:Acyl carrier protein 3, mitochondrial n=4 Tax=Arabidopsis TaxID=3701 RepID=ACPM3_ARATH|nr:mitochondrial acyl carrier protein 3 [Arabidopsis thaliana]NP_001331779.1 mitochondrial acyl carrier protein 3 [Arabidopsis thaliana]NP_199574.1 mitochondrial acyl carrier protein 3 [Arabidopsis thaliana]Q9FGJ4.1 RecName: Full=Acyl carrier protein 3, mitochondrial; AltName: Full=MtACP-3; Short=ACP; AltName: Full=NADH-ubiquinone oxidoreductase 9.6 kDa subunit; Flags: Precursor [Arabidopsis thaliana]KAG7605268.1 Phosphopantetheine binding ACP domain [Arabidopsis thaliana x Arabidopsis arenosa]|eukprot:NP_001078726.1 mitochondrial acyl carrier protein 3 [Arabidopsis thaliana]
MHCIRSSILQHLRLRVSVRPTSLLQNENGFKSIGIFNFTSEAAADGGQDQILSRVIELVKKYDKTNTSEVTERADFQKDLSLDSLDKTELVMAIEEEFSIEIPDEKADKLTCCGDVATYILSETPTKASES